MRCWRILWISTFLRGLRVFVTALTSLITTPHQVEWSTYRPLSPASPALTLAICGAGDAITTRQRRKRANSSRCVTALPNRSRVALSCARTFLPGDIPVVEFASVRGEYALRILLV